MKRSPCPEPATNAHHGLARDRIVLEIIDVVPPWPSKLTDIFSGLREEEEKALAGVVPTFNLIDLRELAPVNRGIVFPCRASGLRSMGPGICFLDEAPQLPEDRNGFTLVGCNLSLKIFMEIYGFRPDFVNMCPRDFVKTHPAGDPDARRLTRCCRVKEGFEKFVSRSAGRTAVLPWGVTREEFLDAVGWLGSARP